MTNDIKQDWATAMDPDLLNSPAALVVLQHRVPYALDVLCNIAMIIEQAINDRFGELTVKANPAKAIFADRVHDMSFSTKIVGNTVNPQARMVLAKTRAQLRRSEKWVIDDEAVRFITTLCRERDELETFSVLARLPFDVMWIEFNLHEKVKQQRRIDEELKNRLPTMNVTKDVSPVLGYLLYRDDPGSISPRWIAQQYYEVEGHVVPGIICYVFDPEGSAYQPTKGSTYWRAPTLSAVPNFPKMPVRMETPIGPTFECSVDPEIVASGDLHLTNGSFTIPAGTDLNSNLIINEENFISSGAWCHNRLAIIYDPFWQAIHGGVNKKVAVLEVYEEVGHIRFLVTLLASINGLPKDIKYANTTLHKRTIGAHVLPYFQHRTVSIKVPNDSRIQWAKKTLQSNYHNAPRAWHRVKGHWRIIERGIVRKNHICRHHPIVVEPGLAICEKCDRTIRWIKQHERGTPEIGIVEHAYKVTT